MADPQRQRHRPCPKPLGGDLDRVLAPPRQRSPVTSSPSTPRSWAATGSCSSSRSKPAKFLRRHYHQPDRRLDTTPADRSLFLGHADRLEGARALVRDYGSQFINAFGEEFKTEGLKILRTPCRYRPRIRSANDGSDPSKENSSANHRVVAHHHLEPSTARPNRHRLRRPLHEPPPPQKVSTPRE